MSKRFTSRDLFRQLSGEPFGNYAALEDRVLDLFSEHFQDFPAQYTGDKLLELGEEKGWIVRAGEKGFSIRFSGEEE